MWCPQIGRYWRQSGPSAAGSHAGHHLVASLLCSSNWSRPVRAAAALRRRRVKNRCAPTRHDHPILATIEASDLDVAGDRRAMGEVGLWALRRVDDQEPRLLAHLPELNRLRLNAAMCRRVLESCHPRRPPELGQIEFVLVGPGRTLCGARPLFSITPIGDREASL